MDKNHRTATYDPKDGGLPYRLAVLMVVFNRQGEIFIGESNKIPSDGKPWQLPQGGIKEFLKGGIWQPERLSETTEREIKEELGVAVQITPVRILPERMTYSFNDDNPKYRGQTLAPVLLHCLSPNNKFDLSAREEGDAHPAFSDWKWARPSEVLDRVTAVKHAIYQQVLAAFTPTIAAHITTFNGENRTIPPSAVRPSRGAHHVQGLHNAPNLTY